MRHPGRIAAAVLILTPGVATNACPVCDSEQGRQVRAGVFDEGFAHNTLETIAAFPVVVGVIVALYAALPNPHRAQDGDRDAA
jgi:hypothetical protein